MFNEEPHYELTVRRELSEFICTTTALMDSLVQHNQPERSSQKSPARAACAATT